MSFIFGYLRGIKRNLTLYIRRIEFIIGVQFTELIPDTWIHKLARSEGSWIDDRFKVGDTITITGSNNNDDTYEIVHIESATVMYVDSSLTDENEVECKVILKLTNPLTQTEYNNFIHNDNKIGDNRRNSLKFGFEEPEEEELASRIIVYGKRLGTFETSISEVTPDNISALDTFDKQKVSIVCVDEFFQEYYMIDNIKLIIGEKFQSNEKTDIPISGKKLV